VDNLPPTLNQVIESFMQLPGIGKKTAYRLGLHILKSNNSDIEKFAQALLDVKNKLTTCIICHNFSEADLCEICANNKRDNNIICICEEPSDIFLIEKTDFQGVYHVLGGLISPLDGIGPENLNMDSLIERTKNATEIIIATDPSVKGDTTALYISKVLNDMPIKMTRLARGLPVGSSLEYVDEVTLAESIHERVEVNSTV